MQEVRGMGKIFFMVAALVFISASSFAEDAYVATIKTSPDLGKAQCASQPGKGITLVWGKVSDKRVSPAVGTFKKGKEELDVLLAGPVDVVIGDVTKTVFKNCGYTVVDKNAPGAVTVSLDVNQFFAGSVKRWFTGETDAKASFSLHLRSELSSYDYDFGATKSDKGLRKKNIQRLEMVLSGLLEETFLQIAESPTLQKEIGKLAGQQQ